VNHISAKHKLAVPFCYLKYCVMVACNRMVTKQLIEESNQMDYLLVLLHFHDSVFQVK
jgi:hypothetical protein